MKFHNAPETKERFVNAHHNIELLQWEQNENTIHPKHCTNFTVFLRDIVDNLLLISAIQQSIYSMREKILYKARALTEDKW